MSAIANFRKRREAEKAQQSPTANETTATPAPENEALHLLAYLLCCDVEEALEVAREAVKKKIHFLNFTIGVDTGEDQDKATAVSVTIDKQYDIASIIDHAAELEDSAATVSDAAETAIDAADKVSESADKVSNAAGDLDDAVSSVDQSASNLAYTADDLGQVAAELKEATAELKKPSAAPESSRGAKAAAPKSSSKKSD
ncbi:hypothetical protein [Shewanella baltica]|uniref:hypothetical protein n=1 Tax=Shewanella baltica TaxID=62322 RepID=UPI00217DA09A|nr:hypothetical protein [Shewanella baltica]MCS6101404.1 hypothetical protein [Shewanella baltica]MCS6184492.1 hypothetical protein [Shewanella baltica]